MADDEEYPVPAGPVEDLFPLLIAVAPSPAERIRLAERVEGLAPLLLVADLGELRRLIGGAHRPAVALSDPAPAAAAADPAPTITPADLAPAAAAADTLLIDSARFVARCRGREISLTRLEHDLLICLTTEPLQVWSYPELHRLVWRDAGLRRKADVQSLVKRLRRKLSELGTGITIDAVRGVGFRLTDHQRPRISNA